MSGQTSGKKRVGAPVFKPQRAPSVRAIDARPSVDGNTVPGKAKVAQLHFIYLYCPSRGPSPGPNTHAVAAFQPFSGQTRTDRKPTMFHEPVVVPSRSRRTIYLAFLSDLTRGPGYSQFTTLSYALDTSCGPAAPSWRLPVRGMQAVPGRHGVEVPSHPCNSELPLVDGELTR